MIHVKDVKDILTGDYARISELDEIVKYVNRQNYIFLEDDAFPAKTEDLRLRAQNNEPFIVEALALVREAAKRTIGMFPYDVQIKSAAAIAKGYVTEQATGEGKMLVGIVASYVLSLYGQGVHVITVNDYLSERDGDAAREVLDFLGVSVGSNKAQAPASEKQLAFDCDVTYTTHSEVGFDYLRDNLAKRPSERVIQRGLQYVIIDEIDSVLIDEARTPLIIANASGEIGVVQYKMAAHFAKSLMPEDVSIDITARTVTLNDSGVDKAEAFYKTESIYDVRYIETVHYINNALKAEFTLDKDVDYVVTEKNEVELIDAFTGRVMEGRRFSDGLHQAIEAKEDVDIKEETMTSASVTYQNLFNIYKHVGGMSGTVMTEREEFFMIYSLHVMAVPTHRPIQRIDQPDALYMTNEGKYRAIIEDVKTRYAKGQPVLIGTVAVEKSEDISKRLDEAGIPHETLNAKNHKKEAEIIKRAGQIGAVTIATNMAGRGTDIKLGDGVREAGGLYVIGTERHESRRIDNQLRGRSGRQGDPGESRFYLSLEDDLLKRFGSEKMKSFYEKNGFKVYEEIPLTRMMKRQVEGAQKRIEGSNYDTRKQVLEYDNVVRAQRQFIYDQRNDIFDLDLESLKSRIMDATIDYILARVKKLPKHATVLDLAEISNPILGEDVKLPDRNSKTFKQDLRVLLEKAFDEKYKAYTDDSVQHVVREVCLTVIDRNWAKQLSILSELKNSVTWRGYAQINPLVAYQRESYDLYNELTGNTVYEIAQLIFK